MLSIKDIRGYHMMVFLGMLPWRPNTCTACHESSSSRPRVAWWVQQLPLIVCVVCLLVHMLLELSVSDAWTTGFLVFRAAHFAGLAGAVWLCRVVKAPQLALEDLTELAELSADSAVAAAEDAAFVRALGRRVWAVTVIGWLFVVVAPFFTFFLGGDVVSEDLREDTTLLYRNMNDTSFALLGLCVRFYSLGASCVAGVLVYLLWSIYGRQTWRIIQQCNEDLPYLIQARQLLIENKDIAADVRELRGVTADVRNKWTYAFPNIQRMAARERHSRKALAIFVPYVVASIGIVVYFMVLSSSSGKLDFVHRGVNPASTVGLLSVSVLCVLVFRVVRRGLLALYKVEYLLSDDPFDVVEQREWLNSVVSVARGGRASDAGQLLQEAAALAAAKASKTTDEDAKEHMGAGRARRGSGLFLDLDLSVGAEVNSSQQQSPAATTAIEMVSLGGASVSPPPQPHGASSPTPLTSTEEVAAAIYRRTDRHHGSFERTLRESIGSLSSSHSQPHEHTAPLAFAQRAGSASSIDDISDYGDAAPRSSISTSSGAPLSKVLTASLNSRTALARVNFSSDNDISVVAALESPNSSRSSRSVFSFNSHSSKRARADVEVVTENVHEQEEEKEVEDEDEEEEQGADQSSNDENAMKVLLAYAFDDSELETSALSSSLRLLALATATSLLLAVVSTFSGQLFFSGRTPTCSSTKQSILRSAVYSKYDCSPGQVVYTRFVQLLLHIYSDCVPQAVFFITHQRTYERRLVVVSFTLMLLNVALVISLGSHELLITQIGFLNVMLQSALCVYAARQLPLENPEQSPLLTKLHCLGLSLVLAVVYLSMTLLGALFSDAGQGGRVVVVFVVVPLLAIVAKSMVNSLAQGLAGIPEVFNNLTYYPILLVLFLMQRLLVFSLSSFDAQLLATLWFATLEICWRGTELVRIFFLKYLTTGNWREAITAAEGQRMQMWRACSIFLVQTLDVTSLFMAFILIVLARLNARVSVQLQSLLAGFVVQLVGELLSAGTANYLQQAYTQRPDPVVAIKVYKAHGLLFCCFSAGIVTMLLGFTVHLVSMDSS